MALYSYGVNLAQLTSLATGPDPYLRRHGAHRRHHCRLRAVLEGRRRGQGRGGELSGEVRRRQRWSRDRRVFFSFLSVAGQVLQIYSVLRRYRVGTPYYSVVHDRNPPLPPLRSFLQISYNNLLGVCLSISSGCDKLEVRRFLRFSERWLSYSVLRTRRPASTEKKTAENSPPRTNRR